MSWLRRTFGRGGEVRPGPPPPPAPSDLARGPDDSPGALAGAVTAVSRLVNRSAGRLPTAAVVNARAVTDVLQEIVRTSALRPLDVYAVLSVRGIAADYLPTTLTTYLAVDPALLDVPGPSGHTASQSLLIQIDALHRSATTTLHAARAQDLDALMSQGLFLRTKFSGSDLDL